MTEEDQKALRERAEKATKDGWKAFEGGSWGGEGFGVAIGLRRPNGQEEVAEWFCADANTQSAADNALYIEMANPTNILELLDQIDALKKKLRETS